MIEGMMYILNPACLGLMLLGTAIGIIFGAIPGLSATMAVAVFLPVTFKLSKTLSIAFLIALYIGGISGGLISAILLNIPGTVSSVATTFDGSPMARAGKAGKALGVAIFSSLIGTVFSVVVLMFVAEPVATFALKFGPLEYFTVCLFALVLLSSLISDSMLKGFSATILGLLVSMVGAAPVGSATRFTFGFRALNLGFPDIPLFIGLFAVADMLTDTAKRTTEHKIEIIQDYKFKGLGFKLSELAGQSWNYLRSCILGLFIGLLPGIGGSAANVVAYTVAKQRSKEPEKFGTGCVDGIVASEASNNACIGGAMIPLLTLGIPGDGPTAMLLGALTIAGITPGPMLFKNNAPFVYAVYTALLIGAFMFFLLETCGLKYFVKILMVPKYYLYPIIIMMCMVGVYGSNSQIFDLAIVIIFGVIGYLFKKFKFPITPFILGYLLGGIMEKYLIRAIQYNRGNLWAGYMKSPISLVFLIITVVVFIYALIKNIRAFVKERG